MSIPSRLTRAALVSAVALAFTVVPLHAQAKPQPEKVQYLRILAQDYTFEAPATATEGITVLHLVNEGLDVHQMSILELGVGHTIKEFFDAMHKTGQPPAWTSEIGMTPTIQPKSEALLAVRLHPGRYLLSCLIPAKDGRSHVEKGMTMLLTVSRKAAPAPAK